MSKTDITMPAAPILPNGMLRDQLVSIGQYAQFRNISKDTVRRLIDKKKITAKKVSARRIGIPAFELFK
jgi:hypothetical protein